MAFAKVAPTKQGAKQMDKQRGFTLIELMVVINSKLLYKYRIC
ncbi:prepilin-type N-terminal cleavage/methylation domain-containing protein [Escherichia coli]